MTGRPRVHRTNSLPILALLLAGWVAPALPALAAISLSIGSGTARPGESVVLTVTAQTSGEPISGLDFMLRSTDGGPAPQPALQPSLAPGASTAGWIAPPTPSEPWRIALQGSPSVTGSAELVKVTLTIDPMTPPGSVYTIFARSAMITTGPQEVDLTSAVSTGQVTVYGSTPPPAGLQIAPPTATVQAGSTLQFQVTPAAAVLWSVQGGAANGTIGPDGLYQAPANVSAAQSATIVAGDGSGRSATAVVTLTPGPGAHGPPVTSDAQVEAITNQATGVRLPATNLNGSALNFLILTPPAHGTLTGAGADRAYTSAAGYVGMDRFTFSVSDDQGTSNISTVTIAVASSPLGLHTLCKTTSGPYVDDLTPFSAEAVWTTDCTGTTDLQYGLTPGMLFTAHGAAGTAHQVSLGSLKPDTIYWGQVSTVYYDPGSGGMVTVQSAPFTFRTASDTPPSVPGVNGLRAEYFQGSADATRQLVRAQVDSQLSFDWGAAPPVAGITGSDFSARWRGYLLAPESGTYTLALASEEGSRISLGGTVIADDRDYHGYAVGRAQVSLSAGQFYPLAIDFVHAAGNARIELRWVRPNDYHEVAVPAGFLALAPDLTGVPGDFNGDGVVGVADATLALQCAVGVRTPDGSELRRADIAPAGQPDGKITLKDVILILRKAIGGG